MVMMMITKMKILMKMMVMLRRRRMMMKMSLQATSFLVNGDAAFTIKNRRLHADVCDGGD